jgi:hypothetical protein
LLFQLSTLSLGSVYRGLKFIDRHVRVASLEAFVQSFDAVCEFVQLAAFRHSDVFQCTTPRALRAAASGGAIDAISCGTAAAIRSLIVFAS